MAGRGHHRGMLRLPNPFFFETPSDRWAFTDRDDLVPKLTELMQARGRRLLVHGRRRMGKTSLMQNAAKKAGAVFIYCDVSKAAGLNEVARRLLEAAPPLEENLLKRVLRIAEKHFKTVTLSAHRVTLAGELRADDGPQTLEGVLNFLYEQAGVMDRPWTVCLDECQDLRQLMGERAAWLIRGITQPHRNLNYLLSGSDHRLVSWLTSPDAAFFKQLSQVDVGTIDAAHLAGWIERRAKVGGLARFPHGPEIVATAGPCTGDVARLAKVTFDLAAAGHTAGVVAAAYDAIALVELNTEFEAHWRNLTLTQRLVLRAVAGGKQPTSSATLRELGLKSASTAQKAIEALVERQFLVRESGKLIFDNPFFRRWVVFNNRS